MDTSLLRFPGSKRRFCEYVRQFAIANQCTCGTIIEPYSGSASVSIALLTDNTCLSALISEIDPLIYSFWKAVFSYNDSFAKLVSATTPTIDTWSECRRWLNLKKPPSSREELIDAAFAYLVLNRTCYSGIITSGPIGGKLQTSAYKINCRFNSHQLALRIRQLKNLASRVSVQHADALDLISSGLCRYDSKTFLYVDPPYFKQGPKLYRYSYAEEDHQRLRNLLLNMDTPWLLSYDDAPQIRDLYKDINYRTVYFDYSIRVSRSASELAISNRLLPPVYIVDGEIRYNNDISA